MTKVCAITKYDMLSMVRGLFSQLENVLFPPPPLPPLAPSSSESLSGSVSLTGVLSSRRRSTSNSSSLRPITPAAATSSRLSLAIHTHVGGSRREQCVGVGVGVCGRLGVLAASDGDKSGARVEESRSGSQERKVSTSDPPCCNSASEGGNLASVPVLGSPSTPKYSPG
ncbi:hypothetical protein E2C01_031006 [Portunus trituberculatus]|uniref:Uncharacterized protein n=1 Tax=Portunus trituberculatus TaxID=210409 RepID=A0A5B7EVQ8_PORTR|nr:hypothetical protein [Portunus trituberculatus]